jgi:hypothetical protein
MSSVSQACGELLVEGRRFAPLYANRLANHLPMALVALDRLGAPAATMQSFAARYARRLKPVADEEGVTDPADQLGAGTHYLPVARHFLDRIARSGAPAVLREWLPVLLPGLAGSAFHCMIRLAYALDAGDEHEIALALAYWVTDHAALPLTMQATEASLDEIAGRMAGAVQGHVFQPGIIIDRMQEIARTAAVAGGPTQPVAPPQLRDVARFALAAYLAREDFTLLHTVTGCHAMRLVLPYADDVQLAVRYLWQAVLAAYLTVDAAGAPGVPHGAALDADDIAARARTSTDDHVIKLCYTALCEYREYGDHGYLRAASRKLALAGLAAD